MGCCKSLFNSNGFLSSRIISNENVTFEEILSSMSANCQQQLRNLPVQEFLAIYKLHLAAEVIAIQELKKMLPDHEDHFVFIDMYEVLSRCYFEIANVDRAAEINEMIVTIMLKYTPKDYKNISLKYYRLAQDYLVQEKWQKTEQCMVKAIETGRLSNKLPLAFIQGLETCLVMVRQNIIDDASLQPIRHYLRSNPGESTQAFIHRATSDMLPIYNEIGKVQIDKTEYNRLPDQQIESQVNDDILNDVLQSLEKYLKEDTFLCRFGRLGGTVCFIAAYFKATQMKTSSLSAVIIEAGLTIIIERMKNESMADDERFAILKQSPFMISYTDEHKSQMKGVRVFEIKAKTPPEDNRIFISIN